MNADTILSSNLLDILFEGRNKAYGAYDLRKSYNKRVSISLMITVAIIAIVFIGSTIGNNFSRAGIRSIEPPDLVLDKIAIIEPPPPAPVLPPPRQLVATIAFPPPLIVKDNLVVKPPPDIDQISKAIIALKTVDGTKYDGMVNPPSDVTGTQVVATPIKKKNEDSVFIAVEIEASFPGGAGEWSKYVSKAVGANIDEFTEPDFGTCMIKFIVDKTGKVSQVEATTMKGTKLAEIATNAIRKGPNWIPAQQNGSYVNAYRFQPVTLTNPNQ